MKIGIIGLGTVGSAIATALYNTGLVREMVLIDRDDKRALATSEDLGAAAAFGFDINIRPGNYRDLKGAEIVIVAAGANQLPGETRTDLLHKNAAVIRDIIPQLVKVADKNVKIIIVTNPLDVMVMLATELSGLPASQVIGTGTMLDSARLRALLSRQFSLSPASIDAYVLGEHGDSSVLNWSAATIGGLSIPEFVKQSKNSLTIAAKKTIEHRVRNAAYEIIKGRKATWDGIAAATANLVRCIAEDARRVLTVSVVENKIALSLPRIVGADGARQTLIPNMDASESRALKQSAETIKKNYVKLGRVK
ncbi:MAG: NAD(P)-binding domain-containing protein [Alphaproteobacteria bacterium]|nr:NAD(P)-binding domain-containing protein [Alphaproteobacteria bacterium]